ncbi:MAG: gas vesicle protein GvpG [Scytonema sp. PMC 1069.18]|nr:gas vesicle protein GvpG [Scytonema sp. PMC 1069.18]MEC4887031.1 gas vesicle protein GvpG [Scytonema sp. PMC 1070.18]
MLLKALLLPVMGPISGVMWIGEKIQERVNTEFDAKENLHKQLLALQLAFDLGEISEEEFEVQEEEMLLKIQALEEEEHCELEEIEEETEELLLENPVLEECNYLNTEYNESQTLVLLP